MDIGIIDGVLGSVDALGYVAGALFAIGYLMVDQIRLRLMVLAGSAFYLLYYSFVSDEPLWTAIYMSLLMATANTFGLAKLLMGRSRLAVPSAYRDLYPRFDALQPGDFGALVRQATRQTLPAGTVLTEEGRAVDTLYFVISGTLTAEKRGEAFDLPSGVFVGEVAYMTRGRSSATTHAAADIEVLAWDFAKLERRSKRDPRFKLALEATLSRDLALKVAFAVAPHTQKARFSMGAEAAPLASSA